MLSFEKYQGAGNDFIIIDTRLQDPLLTEASIRLLCDRRFGIGADGLITISNDPVLPFFMRYYNSDGKESTMCGNGGRCIAWFFVQQTDKPGMIEFNAIDGAHSAFIIQHSEQQAIVRLKMKDVHQITKEENFTVLNTGSPHYVSFYKQVGDIDIRLKGREIRYSPRFGEEGINVDFAAWEDDKLFVRTYERGVEDETLSCGTGVTAAVLAAAEKDPELQSPVKVLTLGGSFEVHFRRVDQAYSDIWLEGPATKVFTGNKEI